MLTVRLGLLIGRITFFAFRQRATFHTAWIVRGHSFRSADIFALPRSIDLTNAGLLTGSFATSLPGGPHSKLRKSSSFSESYAKIGAVPKTRSFQLAARLSAGAKLLQAELYAASCDRHAHLCADQCTSSNERRKPCKSPRN
jgi:hypothetical protein